MAVTLNKIKERIQNNNFVFTEDIHVYRDDMVNIQDNIAIFLDRDEKFIDIIKYMVEFMRNSFLCKLHSREFQILIMLSLIKNGKSLTSYSFPNSLLVKDRDFNKMFNKILDNITTSHENIMFLLNLSLNNVILDGEVYEKLWKMNINISPYFKKITQYCDKLNVGREFLEYIFKNIELKDIRPDLFNSYVEDDVILDILKVKGFRLETKTDNNLDFFLRICLDVHSLKTNQYLEILYNKFGYILSTDKIDEKFINDFSVSSYVCLKNIEFLSTLENFDDFLKNNEFLLIKIVDREGYEYLKRYLN